MSHSPLQSIYLFPSWPRGKGRFFEPISQQKVASPVIHCRVRKFCARTGKNSGKKKKPVGPKARPRSILHRMCQCCQGFPVLLRCLSPDYSREKLSQGLRDESRSQHKEHFEVSFLSQTILGSLNSDCKVMVYFWTCAWLWNEEYLNDEGSMINRVVLEWLRSSLKTELAQSPNWIKLRTKTWNPSSQARGAPGASKQYFKIFLTR